ncbi:MAG: trypsin-like peptidase domain-containing protein [Planctomycetes bacterium]|nr:trypsin-like peptidase domain-containing protein [Planctomycetota bacterium]
MKRLVVLCGSLAAVLVASAMGGSEPDQRRGDISAAARAAFGAHAPSVVNVGGVLSVDLGMMGANEQEIDLIGTVVDKTGLTVVASSILNPFGDEPIEFEPQPGMVVNLSGEVTQVWIQRPDGTRIDAEVVLTDPELDLAFIRPVEAGAESESRVPFEPVDLGEATGGVDVLDSVIWIGRMTKLAGWAPTAHISRVSAVIEQPRVCYLAGTAPGAPVFDGRGRLLGITVMLVDAEEGFNPMAMMMGGGQGPGQPVVLPGAEIKRLVEQATQR